ncbi:MAG: pyruvate kinase [Saprospiraceae bacterium]
MDNLENLRNSLELLENKLQLANNVYQSDLKNIHRNQLASAKNLISYLSLRNDDIRDLQEQLHIFGLSSLASSESHIHRQLQELQMRLGRQYLKKELNPITYDFGKRKLNDRSRKLFGSKNSTSIPHLMVTFDTSFAEDHHLIERLLKSGMNVCRINCAHDDETVWLKMIANIKRAEASTGITSKIYMDLAGPKIRTVLLGKGSKNNKTPVKENQVIHLAEKLKGFKKYETVIGCTLPGIIEQLNCGERVFFDDGLIEAEVIKKENDSIALIVKRISSKKLFIKGGKGINFPDSKIDVPALTDYDISCLAFICSHADLVGYSFVNTVNDIVVLQNLLKRHKNAPYIILKIETPNAVRNLPQLLLQGMHNDIIGLMIARGDLAIEIGFERMSEIQEEILWICEAAHLPVVWATQVLENLNKTGIATRSEVTDAAHSAMAECVMINKGDHIMEVIDMLKNILNRIGGHHVKKRYTFRPLGIATRFIQNHKVE